MVSSDPSTDSPPAAPGGVAPQPTAPPAHRRQAQRWSEADLPWHCLRRDLVDPETLNVVKAACLVEHNAASYGRYLHAIFPDDAAIAGAIDRWVAEEENHGAVLRRWAREVDPAFDGEAALARFADTVRLPEDARTSVRGSRLGELVARCMVEVGTSTFYAALRESAREPVLREICRRIAGDEGRHYRMFLDHARRYRGTRPRYEMLLVALGRIADTGDDELAWAWHAGTGATGPYRRRRARAAFHRASLSRYRFDHIQRAARMLAQAVGFAADGWLARAAGVLGWRLLRLHLRGSVRLAY
jgi:rubrerythrin